VADQTQAENQAPDPDSFQTKPVVLVSATHFIHDIYTTFISPSLPILIEKMSMSLTQAGSLTVFAQLPSLFNPFLGQLADRNQLTRLFLAISPAATAMLLCLIGLAPNYAALALILLAGGVSIALLHVSGPVIISRVSGKSLGRGMGFFMLGGELARTVGPIVTVWAISTFGLEGLWQLVPAGIIASLLLWWQFGRLPGKSGLVKPVSLFAMIKQMRFLLTGVFGIIVARSFMASAITTYLPTYLYSQNGDLWLAGISLAVYEGAGAAGVFISGWLSDKIGRRVILLGAILAAPGLMLSVTLTSGWLMYLCLACLGFSILASGPVMMALMMENAGDNKATANGMFMAMSFAIRASIVLLVGLMGDTFGLQTAFTVCAGLGIIGLPFVLLIPKHN